MSSAAYRLLRQLDDRQAAAWLAELTGIEVDPATMAQACADAGTPALLDVTGLYLTTSGRQFAYGTGLRKVLQATLTDPYKPAIRVTVELEDGLLAEGLIDLREHSLRYSPKSIEALAAGLAEETEAQRELSDLRSALEREQRARQELEQELASYREKELDPRERRSAAQIIAALAAMGGLDLQAPHSAAVTMAHAAAGKLEIPTEPTVVKWLKLAEQNRKG